MSEQIRIEYDDDQLEVIEKISRALRAHGLTTIEERRAWPRITRQNSSSLVNLPIAKAFADYIEAASPDFLPKRRQ